MLFGGSDRSDRRSQELADAARRQREAFAADVGDEHARAWAHDPPPHRRRRSRIVFALLVLFAGFGLLPLLQDSPGGLLRPDCANPGVEVLPARVAPGEPTGWQAAGPERAEYVAAVDAESVRLAGNRPAVASGQLLGSPFGMPGCRSAQAVFTAPAEPGTHLVTLFRRTGAGYTAVASTTFRVVR